jgi:hypothetical protein
LGEWPRAMWLRVGVTRRCRQGLNHVLLVLAALISKQSPSIIVNLHVNLPAASLNHDSKDLMGTVERREYLRGKWTQELQILSTESVRVVIGRASSGFLNLYPCFA